MSTWRLKVSIERTYANSIQNYVSLLISPCRYHRAMQAMRALKSSARWRISPAPRKRLREDPSRDPSGTWRAGDQLWLAGEWDVDESTIGYQTDCPTK